MTVPDELIGSFSSADSAILQLSAVRALTVRKSLSRATKDPRFSAGVTLLGQRAASHLPEEAWSALASLGLIASAAKKMVPQIREVVRLHVTREPAAVPAFASEDRYYAVLAVTYAVGEWTTTWAARLAVNEESAENTRRVALALVVSSAPDMSTVMRTLGAAFASLSVDTADPSTTVGRRLRRVLAALQVEWAASDKEPGDQVGRSLALLVEQTFRRFGTPTVTPLKIEVARHVAALVHEAIRAGFSQSVKASTYEPIELVSSWFKDGAWNEVIAASPECARVEKDIAEALRILVQSGRTDNRILKSLELVAGSERSSDIRRTLASSLAGAPEQALAWLSGRTPVAAVSAGLEESGLRSVDSLLASLLLRVDRLRTSSAHLRSEIAPILAVKDLAAENSLLDFLDRTSDALREFTEICSERQLRLFGKAGERVEFRSSLHEPTDRSNSGYRHAIVVEPGVEVGSGTTGVRVVRKALVEPLD